MPSLSAESSARLQVSSSCKKKRKHVIDDLTAVPRIGINTEGQQVGRTNTPISLEDHHQFMPKRKNLDRMQTVKENSESFKGNESGFHTVKTANHDSFHTPGLMKHEKHENHDKIPHHTTQDAEDVNFINNFINIDNDLVTEEEDYDEEVFEEPDVEILKDRLVERLILEETLEKSFFQCVIFLIGFIVFLEMVHSASPSIDILPIHETISNKYHLQSIAEEVTSISALQDFLYESALRSRFFSPGSSEYVKNPLARSYVTENIIKVPPLYTISPVSNHPKITGEFTFTAWIKTTVQYDTVIAKYKKIPKKKPSISGTSVMNLITTTTNDWKPYQWASNNKDTIKKNSGGEASSDNSNGIGIPSGVSNNSNGIADDSHLLFCWKFDMDSVSYGGHLTIQEENPPFKVKNPSSDDNVEWRNSKLKNQMQDGEWHHFAVLVSETHLQFAHDGVLSEPVELPFPITDCDSHDATVTIGSLTSKTAEVVQVNWFPRLLTRMELKDVRLSGGKTMEAIVSGRSIENLSKSDFEDILKWQSDKDHSDKNNANTITENSNWAVRKLSRYLKIRLDGMEDHLSMLMTTTTTTVQPNFRLLVEDDYYLHSINQNGQTSLDLGEKVWYDEKVWYESPMRLVEKKLEKHDEDDTTRRNRISSEQKRNLFERERIVKERLIEEKKKRTKPYTTETDDHTEIQTERQLLDSNTSNTICVDLGTCPIDVREYMDVSIRTFIESAKDRNTDWSNWIPVDLTISSGGEMNLCNSYLDELLEYKGFYSKITTAQCEFLTTNFFEKATKCYKLPSDRYIVTKSKLPSSDTSDYVTDLHKWSTFRQDIRGDRNVEFENPYFDPLYDCKFFETSDFVIKNSTHHIVRNANNDPVSKFTSRELENLKIEYEMKQQGMNATWNSETPGTNNDSPPLTPKILRITFDKLLTAFFAKKVSKECEDNLSILCPNLCSYCSTKSLPTTGQMVSAIFSSCADEGGHSDWAGSECSWYTKNDPKCVLYGSSFEKEKCRATCGTCDPTADLISIHDLDKDSYLSVDEMQGLQLSTSNKIFGTTASTSKYSSFYFNPSNFMLKMMRWCGYMSRFSGYGDNYSPGALARMNWMYEYDYPLNSAEAFGLLEREFQMITPETFRMSKIPGTYQDRISYAWREYKTCFKELLSWGDIDIDHSIAGSAGSSNTRTPADFYKKQWVGKTFPNVGKPNIIHINPTNGRGYENIEYNEADGQISAYDLTKKGIKYKEASNTARSESMSSFNTRFYHVLLPFTKALGEDVLKGMASSSKLVKGMFDSTVAKQVVATTSSHHRAAEFDSTSALDSTSVAKEFNVSSSTGGIPPSTTSSRRSIEDMRKIEIVNRYPVPSVEVGKQTRAIGVEKLEVHYELCKNHDQCASQTMYTCGLMSIQDSIQDSESGDSETTSSSNKENKDCIRYHNGQHSIYPQVGNYMFCSTKCLTGACGSHGNIVWGTVFDQNLHIDLDTTTSSTTSHNKGWCQPCNACLNGKNTYNGEICPAICNSIPPVEIPPSKFLTTSSSSTISTTSRGGSSLVPPPSTASMRISRTEFPSLDWKLFPKISTSLSSTYWNGVAEYGIDGNFAANDGIMGSDKFACACTNGDPDTYWKLDLGEEYDIIGISVTTCDKGWCSQDQLNIYIDDLKGTPKSKKTCQENVNWPNHYDFTSEIPVVNPKFIRCQDDKETGDNFLRGREITLNLDNRSGLRYIVVCEVEVFARKSSSLPSSSSSSSTLVSNSISTSSSSISTSSSSISTTSSSISTVVLSEDPEATAGFSIQGWFKSFEYQTIVQKSIRFQNVQFPNPDWDDYDLDEIEINGLDQRLSHSYLRNLEQYHCNFGDIRGIGVGSHNDLIGVSSNDLIGINTQTQNHLVVDQTSTSSLINTTSVSITNTNQILDGVYQVLPPLALQGKFIKKQSSFSRSEVSLVAVPGSPSVWRLQVKCGGRSSSSDENGSDENSSGTFSSSSSTSSSKTSFGSTTAALSTIKTSNNDDKNTTPEDGVHVLLEYKNEGVDDFTRQWRRDPLLAGDLTSANALPFGDKSTIANSPLGTTSNVRIRPKTANLKCWTWDYDKFCVRSKWYEKKMQCHLNPLRNQMSPEKWHHYAITKKPFQRSVIDAESGNIKFVLDRTDELTFYVDGAPGATAGSSGSTSGTAFSAMDCGGGLLSTSTVSGPKYDFHQGPYFSNLWTLIDLYEKKLFKEVLPTKPEHEGSLLPLGGTQSSITAFSFLDVELPKSGVINGATLNLCAADLQVNLQWDMNACTSSRKFHDGVEFVAEFHDGDPCNPSTIPPTNLPDEITLEVFGVLDYIDGGLDKYSTFNFKNGEKNKAGYLYELPRTKTKVSWKINARKWREVAAFHRSEEGTGKSSKDESLADSSRYLRRRIGETRSCSFESPDIAGIISEIVAHPSWKWKSAISLLIGYAEDKTNSKKQHSRFHSPFEYTTANPDPYWTSEYNKGFPFSSTVVSDRCLVSKLRDPQVSTCELLEVVRDPLNYYYPLWVSPMESFIHGLTNSPTLKITWCLNKECVSPAFLGGGMDVKYGFGKEVNDIPGMVTVKKTIKKSSSTSSVTSSGGRSLGGRKALESIEKPSNEGNDLEKFKFQDANSDTTVSKDITASTNTKTNTRSLSTTKPNNPDQLPRVLGTVVEVGKSELDGIPRAGMIYGLEFLTRGIYASEVLQTYASEFEQITLRDGPKESIRTAARDKEPSTRSSIRRALSRNQDFSSVSSRRILLSASSSKSLSTSSSTAKKPQIKSSVESPQVESIESSVLNSLYYEKQESHPSRALDVEEYPVQVVSIMPPLMFQSRISLVGCGNHLGNSLSEKMLKFFAIQVKRACQQGYDCSFPESSVIDPFSSESEYLSGYSCLEHNVVDDSSRTTGSSDGMIGSSGSGTTVEKYLDQNPKIYREEVVYPEFLDTLTVPLVFRDKEFKETKNYIDRRTRKVILINVFLTPESGVGTVMELTFLVKPSGVVDTETSLRSFLQMSEDMQDRWRLIYLSGIFLCLLDITLVFGRIKRVYKNRQFWKSGIYTLQRIARDKLKMEDEEVRNYVREHPMYTRVAIDKNSLSYEKDWQKMNVFEKAVRLGREQNRSPKKQLLVVQQQRVKIPTSSIPTNNTTVVATGIAHNSGGAVALGTPNTSPQVLRNRSGNGISPGTLKNGMSQCILKSQNSHTCTGTIDVVDETPFLQNDSPGRVPSEGQHMSPVSSRRGRTRGSKDGRDQSGNWGSPPLRGKSPHFRGKSPHDLGSPAELRSPRDGSSNLVRSLHVNFDSNSTSSSSSSSPPLMPSSSITGSITGYIRKKEKKKLKKDKFTKNVSDKDNETRGNMSIGGDNQDNNQGNYNQRDRDASNSVIRLEAGSVREDVSENQNSVRDTSEPGGMNLKSIRAGTDKLSVTGDRLSITDRMYMIELERENGRQKTKRRKARRRKNGMGSSRSSSPEKNREQSRKTNRPGLQKDQEQNRTTNTTNRADEFLERENTNPVPASRLYKRSNHFMEGRHEMEDPDEAAFMRDHDESPPSEGFHDERPFLEGSHSAGFPEGLSLADAARIQAKTLRPTSLPTSVTPRNGNSDSNGNVQINTRTDINSCLSLRQQGSQSLDLHQQNRFEGFKEVVGKPVKQVVEAGHYLVGSAGVFDTLHQGSHHIVEVGKETIHHVVDTIHHGGEIVMEKVHDGIIENMENRISKKKLDSKIGRISSSSKNENCKESFDNNSLISESDTLDTLDTMRQSNMGRRGAIYENKYFRKYVGHEVNQLLPTISFWDLFDLSLRIGMIVFTTLYFNHFLDIREVFHFSFTRRGSTTSSSVEASNSDDVSRTVVNNNAVLGSFALKFSQILEIPWTAEEISYESKVGEFIDIVVSLMRLFAHDKTLENLGYFIGLLCIWRMIVYLRCHPRIAVLYKTIEASGDDLFHFFIVFGLLYFLLASLATWVFGKTYVEFGSVYQSLMTQFEMLVGNFPFAGAGKENVAVMGPIPIPDQLIYFSYLFLFALIVFFILLNFFLAIIVDCFGKVKQEVLESVVEQTVLFDLCAIISYRIMQRIYSWPDRKILIRDLINWEPADMVQIVEGTTVRQSSKSSVASIENSAQRNSVTSTITGQQRISGVDCIREIEKAKDGGVARDSSGRELAADPANDPVNFTTPNIGNAACNLTFAGANALNTNGANALNTNGVGGTKATVISGNGTVIANGIVAGTTGANPNGSNISNNAASSTARKEHGDGLLRMTPKDFCLDLDAEFSASEGLFKTVEDARRFVMYYSWIVPSVCGSEEEELGLEHSKEWSTLRKLDSLKDKLEKDAREILKDTIDVRDNKKAKRIATKLNLNQGNIGK